MKQNIFIVNFNLLYEILDEIKENLSFQINQYEQPEALIKADNLDVNNSLIISRSNQKLALNKNFNEKNLFYIDNLPTSLSKLV